MIDTNVYYQILPQLFNMSMTASVIILAVLMVRLLLRKAPKVFSYALWAVVLFRLLCPISIPSEFSLLNLLDVPVTEEGSMEYVPENIVHMEYPAVSIPIPGIRDAINEQLPQGEEQLGADPLEFPIAFATNIWVVGIAVLVVYSVVQYALLRRRLVGAARLRDNIYLADHIDTPFAIGLFPPKIYLPSALSAQEQEYIILHEKHHIRRGDHVVKLLAFAALCIHWFNPLVWLAFVLSGRDMEMSCDEAVMKKAGEDIRADYSESLLRLATGRRIIIGTPLAFGEGDTKSRVKNVMKYKRPALWISLAAVIVCIVMAVCFFTNPSADKNNAGARYWVNEILYQAPQYSFAYTLDTAPEYIISDDYILMERTGDKSWQSCGAMHIEEYSRTDLYQLFDPLYNKAHERIDQVKTVYRTDVQDGDHNTFYLVMQTRKNRVLLAVGYGEGLEGRVRWLFELKKENIELTSGELEAEIEDMSGQSVTLFSVYESETMPGQLLVGFYENNGGDMGIARFKYDESRERYVVQGCSNFGGASLYSMTIAEEEGLDHSITIALSSREDLAEVRADCGDMHMSTGVNACPALVVFEWPEILPEDAAVDVRFYNAASEELERAADREYDY